MTSLLETAKAVGGEFLFPLRTPSVVLQIVVFAMFLSLALALASLPPNAFLILIWILIMMLLVAVLPYFLRSLMTYLEARARGSRPEVSGVEQFSWFSNAWSLFPIVPLGIAGAAITRTALNGNDVGAWAVLAGTIVLLPAILCVLAITHSPLQSINPLSWWKLLDRMGPSYLVAPMVIGVLLAAYKVIPGLPVFFDVSVLLYLSFVLFGACGAAIRPFNVVDDVEIVPDETAGEERRRLHDDAQREKLLTHAYGFASRGNATGAVDLVVSSIAEDRNPVAARDWYFGQMMRWDDTFAALKLAQRVLHDMLAGGEEIAAVKLMMRCRMEDRAFRPLPDDLPAAVRAARNCANPELADALSRGN